MTFEEIGLDEQLLEGLDAMGFEKATPIQEKAIPEILKGNDLIGCAQTGTGKTAAFILPTLQDILKNEYKTNSTLIIVPTRELALQIDMQIQGLAYFTGTTSITIYGGGQKGDLNRHKKALKEGVDIVIATPGKLLSYLITKAYVPSGVKNLILDEADRMLDMGFYEDISRIISFLPKERQNLLFSATMAPKILSLAKGILNDPVEVTIGIAKPSEGIEQKAYMAHDEQKTPIVSKVIKEHPEYDSILIFTSTKSKVSKIVRSLNKEGFESKGISSDLEQKDRESVLMEFTNKKLRILVATDVISRGIDIKNINLVINFDVPKNSADYVHRIGRTARASTTGVAITLINSDDIHNFRKIESLIENEVPKFDLPEELGEAPKWQPKPLNKKKKFHKKKKYWKPKNKGNNKGGNNPKNS